MEKMLLKYKQTTMDIHLRWFLLWLLHCIIPTNKYLFMCKICRSSVCIFRNHKDDAISHLIWSCHVTQQFWTDLAALLKDKCVHNGSLSFSEIFVLFSVDETIETERVLDLMVLLAKFYIDTNADYKSPHL